GLGAVHGAARQLELVARAEREVAPADLQHDAPAQHAQALVLAVAVRGVDAIRRIAPAHDLEALGLEHAAQRRLARRAGVAARDVSELHGPSRPDGSPPQTRRPGTEDLRAASQPPRGRRGRGRCAVAYPPPWRPAAARAGPPHPAARNPSPPMLPIALTIAGSDSGGGA